MIPAKEFEGELWIRAADIHLATKNGRRTWVALSDKEIAIIGCKIYGAHHWDDMRFYREVEDKLRKLNT